MGPFDSGRGLVLDVRTPTETARGHVPGALLIPIDELPGRLDEVRAAAGGFDAPILVMCKLGRRAELGVQILRAAGFTRPANIGGTEAEPLRSILGGATARSVEGRARWAPRPRH